MKHVWIILMIFNAIPAIWTWDRVFIVNSWFFYIMWRLEIIDENMASSNDKSKEE